MTLEILLASLPAYAQDLTVNLSAALDQPGLTVLQVWGTAVASAAASRNRVLLEAIKAEAARLLEPAMIEAALGASAIMGMNNIYFRFLHLAQHEQYSTMRSGLRMNVTRGHGAPVVDFELWCVAVSAIHGCGKCIEAHDQQAREKGATEEVVLAVVRIASVVHAVAGVLETQ